MIKKAFWIFLLLLIGVLIYFKISVYPKLAIVSGYAAKKTCSCTFIADRDQESIQSQDLSMTPLNLSKSIIDYENKTVRSSVLGLNGKTAVYKGKQLGCVLLQGKDDYKVSFPAAKLSPQKPMDTIYPYGDIVPNMKMKNVDYVQLEEVINNAFDPDGEMTQKKTAALLVIYKDTIIGERYATGYNADTELLGWSMTKSIMNTMVGMMSMDGMLSIAEDTLFAEWKNDKRATITLNNLLQMSSGLDWEEEYAKISDATNMLYNSENNSLECIDNPLEYAPGEKFYYSSGTSNMISGFLRGKFKNHDQYLLYPYNRIFRKIGMYDTTMEVDESGTYIGSSYCYGTARDWGRFGLLYLNDGVWNGERLLPEGWVDYSRKPISEKVGIYGAHFWTNRGGAYFENTPEDLYFASGYEGQKVIILPSHDVVIVRLGLSKSIDWTGLINGVIGSIKQ